MAKRRHAHHICLRIEPGLTWPSAIVAQASITATGLDKLLALCNSQPTFSPSLSRPP